MQGLIELDRQVAEALALLEATIPRGELVMMIHLTGHLPHQILKFGYLRHSWMFPQESFFGVLKRSIAYRKIPEAAIMTRYCLMQTLQRLGRALDSNKEPQSKPSSAISLLQPAMQSQAAVAPRHTSLLSQSSSEYSNI